MKSSILVPCWSLGFSPSIMKMLQRKWHLILWVHIHFFVRPWMKTVRAWQTRSVSGTQKALVRRKMVPISSLWYSESVAWETRLFLCFLLVGETIQISAVAALGWYLETTMRDRPGLSCVRCYYKRVFVIWGVVFASCSLLLFAIGAEWASGHWSLLTGYGETFEMEE